jgi:hypothetical protein
MGKVYLEPIKHEYINRESDKKYLSVTKFIHRFVNEFPANAIATSMSLKEGETRTKEDILAEWAGKNKKALTYGTAIHELLEKVLKSPGGIYFAKDKRDQKIVDAFNEMNPITSDRVYPERVLYLENHGVAGTADVIEDFDEHFNVWDFKTNKQINFIDKYGKYMLDPVIHLSDCSYNVYALQLSFYAYMYSRETGKKVGRLGILWLNRETGNFEMFPIPYLKREVEALLMTSKNQMNNNGN